ncbi:hypothetical protein PENANT_c063G05547 [Penicillium antarcticum]|uniref:Uncharacterized protein n=1 Tax=Penicillium antarcticum TaxID=416450 RepID=A0A1V6PQT4_9EURO|nr:hypothetical protein PENANT_c063G05547 [Penicillium antarcticum]
MSPERVTEDSKFRQALFALFPWQPIFSHWAENGPAKVQDIPLTYNPAFYGFSPTLVEVIVNSWTAICQNAGLDIDEYVHTPSDKSLSKKRRSRRRRGESQSSQSDADQDLIDCPVDRPPLRR